MTQIRVGGVGWSKTYIDQCVCGIFDPFFCQKKTFCYEIEGVPSPKSMGWVGSQVWVICPK